MIVFVNKQVLSKGIFYFLGNTPLHLAVMLGRKGSIMKYLSLISNIWNS